MGDLSNKVALVTGGSRDIGKEICKALAVKGAKVVMNYNSNRANAESALSEIKALGGEGMIVQADATDAGSVEKMVQQTLAEYGGKIDILVNNAGGLVQRQTLAEMDELFFEKVMRLNFTSAFLLTKYVVPHMAEKSSIINIASQAGRDGGGPGASIYAAAKGALMTFTRAMSKELGAKGIRVNAICPGMISTKFHDDFTNDDVRKFVSSKTPLGREGAPSEVADLVAYLASEQSSFITGASLDINGGLLFS